MNLQLLHQASFYLMFACVALAIFVSIERAIFFRYTTSHTRDIDAMIIGSGRALDEVAAHLATHDGLAAEAIVTLAEERARARNGEEIDHLSQALYLTMKTRLNHRLWILDTIVTAAPLLGLLGTILGIIETFTSLASSGISDPKGVSAGIGTALFATALGIATALFVLLLINYFRDKAERIADHLKTLLLRATIAPHAADLREIVRAA
ncbi:MULTISPECIES: MotA/TolQ/ExbB proton channel family protein [unclassified Paraburkholderia]|uniref:MotA/TolQ/ExbB proton channel family protein n=1 Tax=unclassified Paraburkholderia TaxID=2615204 RepID=UPI002AB1AA13|nr:MULTISPECIES: MotA/TolQ/ExbB proton channel family protein [unclassified Paraburkholderia]